MLNTSVPLDSFLFYLMLYFYIFVFLEERDIKVEQNYILSIVLKRGELKDSN